MNLPIRNNNPTLMALAGLPRRRRGRSVYKIKQALSGRMGAEVRKADGTLVHTIPLFDNLILNNGKNQWLTTTAGPITFAPVVGTGTATPLATDTLLTNYLVSTGSSTIQSAPQTKNFTVAPYYIRKTHRWRFGLGVAAGNITEFGICAELGGFGLTPNSATTLFAKALVKDALGNPIAVTVQADEYLDVIWEFTITVTTSVSGSVNISLFGVVTAFNYDMAPLCGNSINAQVGGWDLNAGSSFAYAPMPRVAPGSSSYSRVYVNSTGTGAAIDEVPAGSGSTSNSDNADGTSRAAYTTGSYYRDFTYTWGLNFGNRPNIRALKLSIGPFGTVCIYLSSAGFTKAGTDTFAFTIRISVS